MQVLLQLAKVEPIVRKVKTMQVIAVAQRIILLPHLTLIRWLRVKSKKVKSRRHQRSLHDAVPSR